MLFAGGAQRDSAGSHEGIQNKVQYWNQNRPQIQRALHLRFKTVLS